MIIDIEWIVIWLLIDQKVQRHGLWFKILMGLCILALLVCMKFSQNHHLKSDFNINPEWLVDTMFLSKFILKNQHYVS